MNINLSVNNWHTQSGASLVELMVAQALGLLLIFGCLQIYLATQKSVALQQAVVAIAENARFASHVLNQNIRMAGYAACDSAAMTQPALAIHGYQTQPPAFIQNKVAKGTDSVVISTCISQNDKETFNQLAFFIGATSRKGALGQTIYALYMNPLDDDKSELVSNVDNMRISYGVTDNSGQNILQYLPADQVTDWSKIRAVAIALLFSSDSPVLPQPQSYEFAGKTMAADRFLHREWDIYIALREML